MWTYLFIITYLNVTTSFHFIDRKSTWGILCHSCTWILNTARVNLIENVLSDFSKNVALLKCPFLLQHILVLISRINPDFIQEITVFDERRLFKKLQDQPFKNCKIWMLAYKEIRRNLDNCSSPYLNTVNQKPKYPYLFVKWVVQMYIYLWSLAFSSCLLTLVMFTSSTVG